MYGGGSFESLNEILKSAKILKTEPFTIFFSKTKYLKKYPKSKTFLIHDKFLSAYFGYKKFLLFVIKKLFLIIYKLYPTISIELQKRIHEKTIRKIIGIIKQNKIEIVHTNNNPARDFCAIEAAYDQKVPCICHLRSFHDSGFTMKLANHCNKKVEQYIAYSAGIKKFWVSKGLQKNKIVVIPNGINPKLKIKQKKCQKVNIGLIGRLIPERNIECALFAFKKIQLKNKDIMLYIAGEGDLFYYLKLQFLAYALGIQKKVIFFGKVKSGITFLKDIAICILPYKIEPFGRILLESWLCEVPTILSNAGMIRKNVKNNFNCLLFKSNDADDLALKIQKMLLDKQLQDRIKKNGLAYCLEKHTSLKTILKILKIYKKIRQKKLLSRNAN